MGDLLPVLFQAQQAHIAKWLLNPYMYGAVVALSVLSLLFPVEPWDRRFVTSMAADYVYGILFTLLYFPVIAVSLFVVKDLADRWIPWINLGLAAYLSPAWQFVAVVLVDDLAAYGSHVLRHKVRPLWHFHAVHHSQSHMNSFTTKRFHPLENWMDKVIIKWIPLAIIGSPIDLWVAYYAVDAVWDYFIHSNIRLNLGPLRYILVSPQFHRIHHSALPRHFDKNFSDRFVFWDLLFGTAHLDYGEYPPTGVHGASLEDEGNLSPAHMIGTHLRHLSHPFRMCYRDYWIATPPGDDRSGHEDPE